MIKFALVCENGHQFDSWFQNGAAYESQAEAGLILCPHCQSSAVTKAIMSPAVALRRPGEPAPARTAPQADAPAKVALLDDRDQELRAMIAGLRQRILEVAEDVGAKFPEEARKIQDGLVPDRPIHGQASFEEARALIEDGIGVLPIPLLPEEQN